MRKVATLSIYICQLSCAKYVFHILEEVTFLTPIYLKCEVNFVRICHLHFVALTYFSASWGSGQDRCTPFCMRVKVRAWSTSLNLVSIAGLVDGEMTHGTLGNLQTRELRCGKLDNSHCRSSPSFVYFNHHMFPSQLDSNWPKFLPCENPASYLIFIGINQNLDVTQFLPLHAGSEKEEKAEGEEEWQKVKGK